MKPRDIVELVTLGALWGASFLFMRMGAAAFGPIALAAVRVAGATLMLLPLLAWRGELPALRAHWRPILLLGITNSALPFALFSAAALAITGGLSSIFNATSPLWAALVAWAWLHDRPTPARLVGLALGFAGVVWLAWDTASLKPGEHGVSATVAIASCLAASALYGFSVNHARHRLAGVAPMAVAAGSQLSATLVLALPALWLWPAQMPGAADWAAAIALALLCTGVAYVLYFRLIAHVGPGNAITVTFLLPLFAMLWGALFLGESVSGSMALGCAVILLGTGLATGVLRWPLRAARAAKATTPADR